jgi:vacuolar-type H+-ATPase subunit C/Vma6
LRRETFAAMLEAESLAQAASLAAGNALDAPPRGENGVDEVTAADVEALAWNRYLHLANLAFRRSHMGLGAVVAYAAIRRVEMGNLITLSEGIRTGMSPQAIRARLVPRADVEAVRV